jgi:hypothetical protein
LADLSARFYRGALRATSVLMLLGGLLLVPAIYAILVGHDQGLELSAAGVVIYLLAATARAALQAYGLASGLALKPRDDGEEGRDTN